MASLTSFFATLLIVLVAAVVPLAVYGNSDGEALCALRRSLSDPENVLQSWDPNLVNPCTWFHVSCDQDGHVTRLCLPSTFTTQIGVMDVADFFDIGIKSDVEVRIEPGLGSSLCLYPSQGFDVDFHIKKLELVPFLHSTVTSFNIDNETNSGILIARYYIRDLGNSNLSGHLVPELGKLEHLKYLELYKNNIQGTIPPELGNLKSLISLDLYNNNLSGVIPPSLGKLKSLVFLRLNDNRLSGRIPRELADISTLKVVDVSNNNLCGPIPTTGSFEHIPLESFEKNPRLEGPELMGLASYDTNCE